MPEAAGASGKWRKFSVVHSEHGALFVAAVIEDHVRYSVRLPRAGGLCYLSAVLFPIYGIRLASHHLGGIVMVRNKEKRLIFTSILCLCGLTALSGCMELTMHPETRKWKKQQEEQMRQFTEAQNQRIAQQREQEQSKSVQMAQVSQPKQEEPPAVKAPEPKKTESVAQVKDTKQENSENKNEPDDLAPPVDYGSNDAGAPTNFVLLSPAEKAALHWAAAQEYWRLHNTRMNSNEYVKWKATTIEKHTTYEGLVNALAVLDQAQKDEQLKRSLNRRGCEWMTGKYYIDRNPSSLCTPVIGKCIEGNCDNGHGTYVSFNGAKFVGEFEQGRATKPGPIHMAGTCLQGTCADGSKYWEGINTAKSNGASSDEGERALKSGNYSTALRIFRPLAEQGDARAQFGLGKMYLKGQGVPQDYVQSAVWFNKSADQGFKKAQHNLGVLYEKGQGVPRDYAQAAGWYRKAAEQGLDVSQVNLGVLYDRGNGVPKNWAAAVFWYRQAAAQGNEDAKYNLRELSSDAVIGLFNGVVGGGSTNAQERDTSSDMDSRIERRIRKNEERARQEDLKERQEEARRSNQKETDHSMKMLIPQHPY